MIRLKVRPTFVCGILCAVFAAGVLGGCGGSLGNGGGGGGGGAWTLTITEVGAFAPGGTGQYSITPTNGGTAGTDGTVTVTDTLPSVFTASSVSGSGWSCGVSPVSCTRSDALAGGASYPTITVVVKVAQSASGTVTDQAAASGGGPTSGSASVQTVIGSGSDNKIQHVVIIFQENRSTDNLFHDPVLINRGADIASSGKDSEGQTITLTPVPLVTDYDLGHGHNAFLKMCDWNGTECLNDAADLTGCSPPADCPSNAEFQYVQASDVQPYFTMAETYGFGDRMFQTNQGPSYPAHQYILSGVSALCVPGASCPGGVTSSDYVADNPTNDRRADNTEGVGCLAPPGAQVNLIDTSQPFPQNAFSYSGSECAEHPTLTDLLDANGLTWRYYAAQDGYIWMAPDSIAHMCLPTSGPPDQLTCTNADWTGSNPKVVTEGVTAQVVTDIQNCNLPSVTWVIPSGGASDHPATNNGSGPSWVSAIVNQIGTNSTCPNGDTYWNDTAIIVTWDDWGGWFDHVAPPIHNSGPYANSYEWGFRVPIVVISPYSKAAYVSHQYNDFGSILKFIEETFGLQEIDPSVGYADSYALGDLSDFFDYNQAPLPFNQIPAKYDRQYFINLKGTPTPPDND